MSGTVVKQSHIHGNGLFAEKRFSAGDVIQVWKDHTRVLSQTELAALSADERRYVSLIDGQYVLFLPPARYVNHSCAPNARGSEGCDVALREILPGEEITVDYVTEQVPDLNLACTCGASNCRAFLKI